MLIKDVMTTEVDLISPLTKIKEAARIMKDDDVGALPVAQDDRLVGVITDRDIVVRTVAEGGDPESMLVRDAMSKKVLYCYHDQGLEDVAANMGDNQVRRLPVINHSKHLVGIVTLGDISKGGAANGAGEALEQICG